MMRKFLKRYICAVLCALTVLTSLCACANKTDEAVESNIAFDTARDSDTAAAIGELTREALEGYTIVYPQFEDDIFEEIVRELTLAIKTKYGVELNTADDFVREGTKFVVKDKEILLGWTNREESKSVCEEIKKVGDYEIRLVGEKLVIAGMSKESMTDAVKKFIEIMESNGDEILFEQSQSVSFKVMYELETITLNGTDISEYTIVYQDNCEKLARSISELITERTGIALTLQSTIKSLPEGKNIYVGNTTAPKPYSKNDEDAYFIGVVNDDFYLYSEDIVGVNRAVNEFVEALNNTNGSVTVDAGRITYEDTSLKSMTFNVYWDTSDSTRVNNVITTIKKHMPDTFGVQEATGEWMNKLNDALKDDYAYVGVGRNGTGDINDEYCAVFYRKDKFKLVDSGTKWLSRTPDKVSKMEGAIYQRIFTYALLEDIQTKKQLVHINTHTDHVSPDEGGYQVRLEQVKVITAFIKANFADIPYIVSGDLNDPKTAPSISHLLASGMDDSADIALISDKEPTFKQTTIDFLLVSEGDFTVYEYDVETEKFNGSYPSDHRAVIIKYDLN